ncbi:MAG: DUF2933 domain-containing protein [Acidothermus sp.]|nr:DUF2933 domain-containing protein [Acidothermus sp.]MCL6538416.1 DUF2933 domain-containing protein [Acidothermus sp.]
MRGKHFAQMAIGAAILPGLFVLAGFPLERALPYALVLACPLMMVVMMAFMSRGDHHHGGCGTDHRRSGDDAATLPPERTESSTRQ